MKKLIALITAVISACCPSASIRESADRTSGVYSNYGGCSVLTRDEVKFIWATTLRQSAESSTADASRAAALAVGNLCSRRNSSSCFQVCMDDASSKIDSAAQDTAY